MPENEYGYLTVTVRTAGGALPLKDTVVTIRDDGGDILAVFFTDESGNTPKLKVLAPPKANSQTPDAADPPFFTYSVDSDKAGYISVRNIDVPVYPGVTSVQPVEMIPLPEGGSGAYRYGGYGGDGGVTYSENVPPEL